MFENFVTVCIGTYPNGETKNAREGIETLTTWEGIPVFRSRMERVRPVLTGYAKKKGGADKKRNQSNDWLRF